MTDRMTPTQRSYTMSRIRSQRNRTTELRLVAQMRAKRLSGWRRNTKLLGRPDLVFARQRIAVFVDGCFWHGCPRCFSLPKSNVDYWRQKIAGNRRRDMKVRRALRSSGWKVIRIWEHSLAASESRVAVRIGRAITSRASPLR